MIAHEFNGRYDDIPSPYATKGNTAKAKKLRHELQIAKQEAESILIEEFGVALKKEYGGHLTDDAHEILFRSAWSDGHHAGFEESEHQYQNKLDFFDRLTEANQPTGVNHKDGE